MDISLPRDWVITIKKWNESKLKCVRCGTSYKLSDNMGKWNCYQHIDLARNRPTSSGEKWSCCGIIYSETQRITTCGCIPCDHSAENYTLDPFSDSIIMPRTVAKEIGVKSEAITIDESDTDSQRKGLVKILRCDPIKYNIQISKYNNNTMSTYYN